jgi:diguanylate cyclase (GGDEF)-like protein
MLPNVAHPTMDINKLSLPDLREKFELLNAQNLQMRQALDFAASQLQTQNTQFETAMDSLKLGFCIFSAQHCITTNNERLRRLLKLNSTDHTIGITAADFFQWMLSNLGPLALGHARAENYIVLCRSTEKASLNLVFQSGQVIHIAHSAGAFGGFVQTFEDVTDRRKAEAKASHLASHDVLTDLPNRRLLKQHIHVSLNDTHADCAVLCVDLDRFKSVNDSLGHAGGDALLVEVTKRLKSCVRAGDTVGRLGGDEFVILIASVLDRDDAAAMASRVVTEIGKPFDILGHSVLVGASVGVAMAPSDGDSPDRLIKSADMALFEAKRDGRGCYRFFEPELEERARQRQALENDVRIAVDKGQFELHFQPVFSARHQKLVGFEALIRWNHPIRGRVSPLDFIPITEELGLITKLGDWIIDEACRCAVQWPDGVVVAVNVSARQFINHDLCSVINQSLLRHGLAPSRLEIEVTESAIMENGSEVAATLQRLRHQGIGIAMDDFGTGYSSLAYLRRFHFSKVKIDRSFINGLETEAQSIAIVRAIVALCKSLNIVVTAEGVETDAQADILRLENCDFLQGFLLGKPTHAHEVFKLFGAAAPAKTELAS